LGKDKKSREDIELAVRGQTTVVDMITANHTIEHYSEGAGGAKLQCSVYAYLKGSKEDSDLGIQFVSGLPGTAQSLTNTVENPERELDTYAGQIRMSVFAALPASENDEHFCKNESNEHCVQDEHTVVYQVQLWITGKVLVGAIIDAANEAFKSGFSTKIFSGSYDATNPPKFGWGKDCGELGPEATVTSYVLGDFGEDDLLKFERSDEIEDVDGYDENLDNLQFIVYNAVEDGKPSCDLGNFWADAQMMKKYRCKDDGSHVSISERVQKNNVMEYYVPDWPQLMGPHVSKTE